MSAQLYNDPEFQKNVRRIVNLYEDNLLESQNMDNAARLLARAIQAFDTEQERLAEQERLDATREQREADYDARRRERNQNSQAHGRRRR